VPLQLELEFTAIPEGVSTARAAITGLCQRIQLPDDIVTRVKIAVNEACINCVQHAYTSEGDGSKTYMLEARVEHAALVVTINDDGVGILRDAPSPNAGLGMGLRLMEQLANDLVITSNPGRGTRVEMRFDIPRAPADGN
jgi:anti-sigma regulatory factor (Ser/Thr protein kinase)